eukprot:TRINITY_DN5547_c0_g2_i2.p1 TRINITY_DN5547_c0_g2~~TRINITY_DN5547_c0_g2_i2.p1  ORF type:complete len:531 (+),score=63.39 TRINITY_DN5547_c0_g2_i2:31-1623(+)
MLKSAVALLWLLVVFAYARKPWEIQLPREFMWGVSTAAFQIEGAYNEDGKGLSIWDTFCANASRCKGQNGNVADDHYHRVAEDVVLLKKLKVNYYRMSLSWSRLLPTGRLPVNQKGVDHYNNEINLLLAAGIEPFVTLYHWDLPQELENQGGWLNPSTNLAFETYANISFSLFGDRVKYWTTFNEPYVVAWLGYGDGIYAPGRCSDRKICDQGDSSTEPYLVAHNLLLSHARAVSVYRNFYSSQNGQIGMAINSDWAEPLDPDNLSDQAAAVRYLEFLCGWFGDPVYFGDYPQSMKDGVGSRLPTFTEEEKNLLKGSADFFGLNHYTSVYATSPTSNLGEGWPQDSGVNTTRLRNGIPIGPVADSDWLYVVPWGIRKLVNWIHTRYEAGIIITENGCDVPDENNMTIASALNDTFRVKYYQEYLSELSKAAFEDNVNLLGYFAWSLMDNVEWTEGTSKRFGLYYVNFKDGLSRIPKQSATFYTQVINFNEHLILSYWPYLFATLVPVAAIVILSLAIFLHRKRQSSYQAL